MTTNFDMKLVLEMKEQMHRIAEGAWEKRNMKALLKAKGLSETSPLKEFLELPVLERNFAIEDYKRECKRKEMAGWKTKILVAFGEDEADHQTLCFRPLDDGTVRVWLSMVPATQMTDRDYDPAKDNYEGWYHKELGIPHQQNNEVMPIQEARKLWVESLKKIAYNCPVEGKVMMYTPAVAY